MKLSRTSPHSVGLCHPPSPLSFELGPCLSKRQNVFNFQMIRAKAIYVVNNTSDAIRYQYHHVSEVSSRHLKTKLWGVLCVEGAHHFGFDAKTVSISQPNKTKKDKTNIPWSLPPELRIQQPSKLINKPSDVGKRAFESPANLAVVEPRGQGSGVIQFS